MQPDNPLLHTKHIFRVGLLLIGAVVALVLGRSAFVPKSWGEFGWYRGDNVAQQRAKAVIHGGDDSCKSCHDEQFQKHAAGPHHTVRCENCHAPVVKHAVGDKKTADMPVNKNRSLCILCHRALPSRPKDFPQIQPRQHVDENGGDWGEEVCIECHAPHSP